MAVFDGKNYIFEVMRPFLKLVKRDARQIDVDKNGVTGLTFTDFDGDVKSLDLKQFNKWTAQADLTLPGDQNTFYPVVITSDDKLAIKNYTVQRYVHWDGDSSGLLKLDIEALTDCDCCGWALHWKIKEYQRSDHRVFVSQVVSFAGNAINNTDRENILYSREGITTSQVGDSGKSSFVIWLRGGYRYQFGSDYTIDTISIYTGTDTIPISGCTNKTIDGELTTIKDNIFDGESIYWRGYAEEEKRERSKMFNIISASNGVLNPNPNFHLGTFGWTDTVGLKNDKYSYMKIDIPNTLGQDALLVSEARPTIIGDEYIHIDSSGKEFRANVRLVGTSDAQTAEMAFYFGVKCFDRQKKFISLNCVYAQDDGSGKPKYDTLVRDLKAGDSEIVIDGRKSIYDGSCSHCRSLAFHPLQDNGKYCYKDSDGYYYTELGYTRHTLMYAYDEGQITDNGDGTFTIRLKRPWEWGTHPAGTRVRSTRYGGTYNYWLSFSRAIINGELQWKKSGWLNWKSNNPLDNTRFRNGTYYAKLMLLANYAYKGSDGNWHYAAKDYENLKVWYTNLELQWRNND